MKGILKLDSSEIQRAIAYWISNETEFGRNQNHVIDYCDVSIVMDSTNKIYADVFFEEDTSIDK